MDIMQFSLTLLSKNIYCGLNHPSPVAAVVYGNVPLCLSKLSACVLSSH